MAAGKINFLTDVNPSLKVGMLWPMKSSAVMMFREINPNVVPPIRGRVEGGVSQGYFFSWNADGSCNNGDIAFHLRTPAERASASQRYDENTPHSDDYYG